MRLTCPNCGAEYDVPEGMVPEDGRHVQCTSCQTRWYAFGGEAALPSTEQVIHRLEQWKPREATSTPVAPISVDGAIDETKSSDDDRKDETPPPKAANDAPPKPTAPGAEGLREVKAAPSVQEDKTAVKPETRLQPPEPKPEPEQEPEEQPESSVPKDPAVVSIKAARGEASPASTSPVPPPGRMDDAPTPKDAFAPPPPGRRAQPMELPEAPAMHRAIWLDSPEDLQSRYRAGLMFALALYALALAAYLWSDDLARLFPSVGAILNGYSAGIDGLRVWIEQIFSALFGSNPAG